MGKQNGMDRRAIGRFCVVLNNILIIPLYQVVPGLVEHVCRAEEQQVSRRRW